MSTIGGVCRFPVGASEQDKAESHTPPELLDWDELRGAKPSLYGACRSTKNSHLVGTGESAGGFWA